MVGMIAKVKPDISADQSFYGILAGLTAALAARETDFLLAVDQEDDPVQPYKKLLERDILDGFILNAPVLNDPRVNFLQEQGIPFVVHGQDRPAPDYPTYGIDNASVSVTSVNLVANLGHRHIALFNGDLVNAYAYDRMQGFRAAIEAKGLSDQAICKSVTYESQAYASALEVLAREPGPTAFLCADTVIASGVMRAVKDRRLRVPDDVSIMAHDDAFPLARAIDFDPALTVTRAPLRDACIPLANLLIDHLNGKQAGQLQELGDVELIVRGSTGPARLED